MEERRERVLTPSAGAAAYLGRRHAGSRWRNAMETAVNENSELVLNPLLHVLWPCVCDCLSVSVTSRCSVETDGRTD